MTRRAVIPDKEFVTISLWFAKWGGMIVLTAMTVRYILKDHTWGVVICAILFFLWYFLHPLFNQKIRSMHEDILRWDKEGRYDR